MTAVLWVIGGWLGLNVVIAVIAVLCQRDRPRDVHEILDEARERD